MKQWSLCIYRFTEIFSCQKHYLHTLYSSHSGSQDSKKISQWIWSNKNSEVIVSPEMSHEKGRAEEKRMKLYRKVILF